MSTFEKEDGDIKKHPEVQKLYGYDTNTKYILLFWFFSQIFIAYLLRESSYLLIFIVGYIYGGFAGHAMFLGAHEISHNLLFQSAVLNDLFGVFIDLATIIPHFSMFKKYHADHHHYQGSVSGDADIPMAFEGKYFNTPITKTIWLFLQPLFYAIRPLVLLPKPIDFFDIFNISACFIANVIFYNFFGMKFVVYLLISGILGGGLHPISGHYIAEHYNFFGKKT